MIKGVLKIVLFAAVCLGGVLPANAQLIKRRKLSVKEQLTLERQRTDSLASLIEEYRIREGELQEALLKKQEAEKYQPKPLFTVNYTPEHADSLAEQLKVEQVGNAFQNFFEEYV
ncbi:MAG: hypothetical protein II236_00760, partial [Alistipes sp.]|nr:hypothetical protein [Alistipes sp.]